MPRASRTAIGGIVYHVLNRANARRTIFQCDGDYQAFERILAEAHARLPMGILAYCIMPNHWHFALRPRADGDLSEFMRWLTVTHTNRWHAAHGTTGTGHLYQGRFKSFPVQARRPTAAERRQGVLETSISLWSMLRYVESNALRAGLVRRAEQWRWGSLWRRTSGKADQRAILTDPTDGWPDDWLEWVNQLQGDEELEALRHSVARGRPLGAPAWVTRIAEKLGLASTLRPRGRPRKQPKKGS
ncbi:MAG: transposase [Phycisphaerae bacterium]